jgi:hypothetical protein
MRDPDPRTWRLFDLTAGEVIELRCPCGRIIEFQQGVLQRLYRLPSDTLLIDLQYRLRCRHCNRRQGFRIAVVDLTGRGDRSIPRTETIITAGDISPS